MGAHNIPHVLDHHTKWLRSPFHAEMFTQKVYYHTQRQYFFVDMSIGVRFFQCPTAKLLILVHNNIFTSLELGCLILGLVWVFFSPQTKQQKDLWISLNIHFHYVNEEF